MATPHDDLFRYVFQFVALTATWLRSVLPPPIVAALDWSTLTTAPEALQGEPLGLLLADGVFHAERHDGTGTVWLLVEHKSTDDPFVEDQLLRYAVCLRDRAPRDGAAPPIPVIPVLLHHGSRPFSARERPGDPVAVCIPRLRFFVDDLAAQNEIELRTRDLPPLVTLAVLCMRTLRGLDETAALAAFDRWGDLMRAADRSVGLPRGADAMRAIAFYTLRVVDIAPRKLHEAFERILQRQEDTIMNTAERLHREGLEKGRVEGRVEGRAEIVLRLLAKRFGSLPGDVEARVRGAKSEELDRWTDRILDAPTIGSVLDG